MSARSAGKGRRAAPLPPELRQPREIEPADGLRLPLGPVDIAAEALVELLALIGELPADLAPEQSRLRPEGPGAAHEALMVEPLPEAVSLGRAVDLGSEIAAAIGKRPGGEPARPAVTLQIDAVPVRKEGVGRRRREARLLPIRASP